MQSTMIQVKPADLENKIAGLKDKNFDIAIIFSSREIIEDGKSIAAIRRALPDMQIMGCSTSGEIGDGVEDNTISILAMHFEKSRIKCIPIEIKDSNDSKKAGQEMAKSLMADDLKGIFVLMPGVNVNGSTFTQGIKDILPDNISLSGGLAGDGLNFGATKTFMNDTLYDNYAVGIGFYGEAIEIRSNAKGGWKPFGPLRRVTKAENNVLYELDEKSALALYKEYLGDKANDLPSSGLLYPFAIMDDKNTDSVGLIRTILNIDEENGSLILAGDMEVGQKVCLMHANTEQLVDGAGEAANMLGDCETDNGALICVSCVGRKILMGDDTEDELDAIRDALGDNLPTTGFYSYGEICHFEGTNQAELHNQTMTLTYITEKAA